MSHRLDPLFRPRSVVYVGGSNLGPALRYQREIGYAGEVWVVSPTHEALEGFPCVPSAADLPITPELAFVAVPRHAAVQSIAELRELGCAAFVCNAAGFAETGADGAGLQAQLVEAAGGAPMLGPNSMGLVNWAVPMAAMMNHFGMRTDEHGVALVSQGGGLLCDAAFSDRDVPITHMAGGGNQAVTGVEELVDYLLDEPCVTAVGLSFEGLRDVPTLRRAAVKSQRLGKPIVAIKLGRTAVGAQAVASHTASMTGTGTAWDALLDRVGIISTRSESEFFETLKLVASGHMPKGRRILLTSVSGVSGVLVSDHLSGAGFELPQPSATHRRRLREILPVMATPGNPQDVTMGAWNDTDRQRAIYSTLLEEGYDAALMIQNYPREGMWDVEEYSAQVDALGQACAGGIPAIQLAPMSDCFPPQAREHTRQAGLVPMQGLDECVSALAHAVWWRERRTQLSTADLEDLIVPMAVGTVPGEHQDEAAAKTMLRDSGVPVPRFRVVPAESAAQAAQSIGYPVVLKALDARLLHKTEVGAVRVGLASAAAVVEAVEAMRSDMRRLAPGIPVSSVLVEAMTSEVIVEMMASVTRDPAVGPVMMIAGGGTDAEIWNDSALIAEPFTREEISRALDRLRIIARLRGWRGGPPGDRESLLTALEAVARFAHASGADEVEVNPILVTRDEALAVDAVVRAPGQMKAAIPLPTPTPDEGTYGAGSAHLARTTAALADSGATE